MWITRPLRTFIGARNPWDCQSYRATSHATYAPVRRPAWAYPAGRLAQPAPTPLHVVPRAHPRQTPRPGCGSQYGIKCERRCRRETALALISPVDYGMAETVYEGNTWMMAVELGVTIQVLNDYRQLLYDSGVCVQ